MKLGKLEKVDLRELWKREDTKFTPWLASEEGIELLSEAIDIDLEVRGEEEKIGPFRADILCFDTTDEDHLILIENQLEQTDHKHLGQLMTYAAGLNSITLVWIAKEFREEHRATLDWLNVITNKQFRFWGIEVEAYRINGSVPAPKFNIIARPNDWSKENNKLLNQGSSLIQIYLHELKDYMEESGSSFKINPPRTKNYMSISMGKTGIKLRPFAKISNQTIGIKLDIEIKDDNSTFDKLKELDKGEAQNKISSDIEWQRKENNNRSSIKLITDANVEDKTKWNEQFEWFKENLEAFDKHFKPLIKQL